MDPRQYHRPVLGREVLAYLGGATHVLDGTLGGGGHAELLLERGVRVTGVDRDPEAREAAAERLAPYAQAGALRIVSGTYGGVAGTGANAATALAPDQQFDGVLLDLGVSSHQLDDEERGFTFREGAPLDMRMEGAGETAAEWLNGASEQQLAQVFKDFGDEPKARRLARTVVYRRQNRPFAISDDFVGAIRAVLGPRSGPADFARLFQSVRMAVNDELGDLERALPLLRDRLTPGGVIVVIAYHSGEDRVVKRAFQEWSKACVCPPRQFICTCGGVPLGTLLPRKPVVASDDEVADNPRARSARLRAWRRDR